MQILKYPHESLITKTKPITEFEPYITLLGSELLRLMIKGDGIGLAANQIGFNLSIFVSSVLPDHIICNPSWKPTPSAFDYDVVEGCLSFPGWLVPIKRYNAIFAEYYTFCGKKVNTVFRGLAAQVFQHETAHLNGLTIMDFITKAQKRTIKRHSKQRRK